MSKVFGKEPVTSSQFPVVLYAARGLLVHSTPAFDRFCLEFFRHQKLKDDWALSAASTDEKQLQKFLIEIRSDLNQLVQNNHKIEIDKTYWFSSLLRRVVKTDIQAAWVEEMSLAHKASIKWVIPDYVMNVCDQLQERGYRLAVASNADHTLAQMFRLQGLLGTFDVILTSDDLASKKPHPDFFEMACEDMNVEPQEVVYIGPSYALDVFAAKKSGLQSVLYDPHYLELRSLSEDADTSGKVVSLESLRNHRALRDVRVLVKFEELLDFFK